MNKLVVKIGLIVLALGIVGSCASVDSTIGGILYEGESNMSRKDELEGLKEKLRRKEIYDFRKELEDFLQEDNDEYTRELQNAIPGKLDGLPFPYDNFQSFLDDYQRNNPTQSATYGLSKGGLEGVEESK